MKDLREVLLGAMDRAVRARRDADCRRGAYGACLVSPDGCLVSSGANGIPFEGQSCVGGDCPRGVGSDLSGYPCLAQHAELSCLIAGSAAARNGTIVVTGSPCPQCAIAIVSYGVAAVVMPCGVSHRNDWDVSTRLLNDAAVEIGYLDLRAE